MEPIKQEEAAHLVVQDFEEAVRLIAQIKAELAVNPRDEVRENNLALLLRAQDAFYHVRDGHSVDTERMGRLIDLVKIEAGK